MKSRVVLKVFLRSLKIQ